MTQLHLSKSSHFLVLRPWAQLLYEENPSFHLGHLQKRPTIRPITKKLASCHSQDVPDLQDFMTCFSCVRRGR